MEFFLRRKISHMLSFGDKLARESYTVNDASDHARGIDSAIRIFRISCV